MDLNASFEWTYEALSRLGFVGAGHKWLCFILYNNFLIFLLLRFVIKMSTNLKSQPDSLFIGVDVGTGGVRAALVDVSGTVLRNAQQPIDIYEPKPGYYEQSSANIWEACVAVVKVENISPILCNQSWNFLLSHRNLRLKK